LTAAGRADAQELRAEGGYFRDAHGAVIVLRGLNVSGDAKVPPFRTVDDVRMLDPFASWGVNVARLLFIWEAFEPEPGDYDTGYLDYYVSIVDALHARNVWVIVDIHQDAFSRFATDGCGEGMPEWAVSPDTEKHDPDNGPDCRNWGIKFILDTDTHRCWDDFYADTYGVRTRYLAMLDRVASALEGHEGVIGYDALNEPWADEKKQLTPLYDDAERVIRAHAPEAIMFVSPRALTSAGQDTELARPTFDNFAYAPHYYDGGIVTLHSWSGQDLEEPVSVMQRRAEAWDAPLFVGELGAPADAERGLAYVDAFYASLDRRFASAAQWSFVAHWTEARKDGWNDEDFSIVDAAHELRANYRIRPYPARIAGAPESFEDRPGEHVELRYEHEPSLGATRIFAPGLALFGAQLEAEVEGPVRCGVEPGGRHVRCEGDEAGPTRIVLRACREAAACLPPVPSDDPGADAGGGGEPTASSDTGMAPRDGDAAGPTKRSNDRSSQGTGCETSRGGTHLGLGVLVALVTSALLRRRRGRKS
jgi:endoglycosylceramidase